MTPTEAKRLKVGDRVTWLGDPKDGGTVKEMADCAAYIEWDAQNLSGYIDFRDFGDLRRAPEGGE